jgi:hypothetical protein
MTEYFHIINFQHIPAKGYGVAVSGNGIVQSIPFDMQEVSRMVGRNIAEIKARVGDKGIVVRINDLIKNDNNEIR